MSLKAITNEPLLPEIAETPTDSTENDNTCRLLIVEDNHDIATYICSLFSESYAISYAGNGKEGLEKALDLVPDLIITDLMMPGIDGLELCRQELGNDVINHVPIIVVTAKITEEESVKGIEAGADAYLSKPFNTDELCTRVENLLAGRKLLQEKFTKILVSSKKGTDQETDLSKETDLRFLSKVKSLVYIQLNRNKETDVPIKPSQMCMSPRQFYRKINALTVRHHQLIFNILKLRKHAICWTKTPI